MKSPGQFYYLDFCSSPSRIFRKLFSELRSAITPISSAGDHAPIVVDGTRCVGFDAAFAAIARFLAEALSDHDLALRGRNWPAIAALNRLVQNRHRIYFCESVGQDQINCSCYGYPVLKRKSCRPVASHIVELVKERQLLAEIMIN